MEKFSLRKATTADIDFIFYVRTLTMKSDFEGTFGWKDSEQYERAADEIDQAQIIMLHKEQIGVIKILAKENELHLHQMQILPRYQGKGIGTALVQNLLDRADSQQFSVTLFVLKNARAKNLYDRMGFSVIENNAHNFKMYRYPSNESYSTA